MKWSKLTAILLLAALAAGCGGGGGGGDNGDNVETSVSISPPAAAVVLNGTALFSATVSGARSATIAATGGAVRANNVVTITTTAAHNFAVGNIINVVGVTDSSFAGTFTIASVPSSTTFTYPQTGPDATASNGLVTTNVVKWFVNDVEGGNSTFGTITTNGLYTAPAAIPPPLTVSIAANGVRRASNVVTITTAADHGFLTGQVVQISGVTDTSFNGSFFIVSVPSTTTFSFSQQGSDTTSTGGTVSSNAVKIKAVSAADTTKSATAIASISSGVVVTVSPKVASLATGEDFQFSATVTGTSNTAVTWFVNDVQGGNSTVGTITAAGLYTAPAAPPTSGSATITASGAVRASNVVTITTAAPHGFQAGASVVIAGVADTTFNGTFTISSVPSTTTFTYAQTAADSNSGGGTATAASATVAIKAVSVVDTLRFDTAGAEVRSVGDPTFTELHPTTVAQGAAVLDIYLIGTNFLSTSKVRVAGTEVPSAAASPTLLRARVPANLLTTVGALAVDVQRFNGATSASLNLNVVAGRPALVGSSPDSAVQGPGGLSVNFNGGYFSASVSAEFNGQLRAASPTSSRQLNVAVSSGDLATAGLFPILVRNSAATPPIAATNVAVQPSATPAVTATVAVGTQPSDVAVNAGTGVAVVANRGSNNISVIDLASNTVTATIAVGTSPTGVAVDNVRNLAVVANNGSDNISIVNLATNAVVATIASPSPSPGAPALKPFAVAVNSVTGLAVVANQSTDRCTVINLADNSIKGTITASTGANPSVAVEPRLNWALITPGGAGTLSIVDLGRLGVVATATVGATMRGVDISPETERALMVDPAATSVSIMSVLDQSISQLALDIAMVDAAINPFTDIGVAVDPNLDRASIIDLGTPTRLSTLAVGTDPRAVAIDPGTNVAVIANEGSDNVSIVSLGAVRPLHILQIGPVASLTSATDVTVELVGSGFTAGSQARLDETNITTTFVSSRRLTATVPAAMLAAPRRFALDVVDGGSRSNVVGFVVVQAIPVGTAPRAVAFDPERNLTLVANAGSGNVTVVDNSTGAVTATIAVGGNPQGVAVLSRAGVAIVTNRNDKTASLISLATNAVTSTPDVGSEPIGVAVNPASGLAYVANSTDNSVSFLSLTGATTSGTFLVDNRPVALAVDPLRNRIAVTHTSQNTVTLFNLDGNAIVRRISGFQIPTAVTYDPTTENFIALSSLTNNLALIDQDTFQATGVRVGINPTGLAYNFNSSTLVTVNTASRTATILDMLDRKVRAVLDLDLGATGALATCRVNPTDSNSIAQLCAFSVDVDVQRNLAMVADEGRNRLLIIPLPR